MKRSCVVVSVVLASLAGAAELPKRYTETIGTKKGEKVSFEMVLIPGGTFTMGSPQNEKDREEHEGPQHKVHIKPFYLATTETTFDLYFAFHKETSEPCNMPHMGPLSEVQMPPMEEYEAAVRWPDKVSQGAMCIYGDLTHGWGGGERPASGLTWMSAMVFCKWLRKKTGKHYRLPTEAEWEYACRAGTTTPYFSGTDPESMDAFAWYEDTYDEGTEPVATKKPNAFGLYDMQGNVREWVFDFYAPDAYSQKEFNPLHVNPGGPLKGDVHVARGGAYGSPVDELRSAARFPEMEWWRAEDPQEPKSRWWLPKRPFIGFRVAREIE